MYILELIRVWPFQEAVINLMMVLNAEFFAGFDGGAFLEIGVTPKFMIQLK